MNIVPFWKTFVTRKMSTIFKSELYSTFSNSTIMNKNKQVSHSKQGTISPPPIPLLPKIQCDQFDLTRNSKNYCRLRVKTLRFKTLLINCKLGECVRWGGGGGVVGSEWLWEGSAKPDGLVIWRNQNQTLLSIRISAAVFISVDWRRVSL